MTRAPLPAPGARDVHVWAVMLDLPAAAVQWYWSLLAPHERERAARFHSTRDRDRFVVARGTLREMLGACLDADPRDLAFTSGRFGKPRLDLPDAPRFNLAHASGLALYGLAAGREIGIDLEPVRPELDCLTLARHWFPPAEAAWLAGLPEDERPTAFARCWVRKEACLKGLGVGLGGLPDARADAAPLGWTLHELDLGPDYAGAVAVEGHGVRLLCRHWSP